VREAFAANLAGNQEVGAAVGVYLHGRKVVDLWGGIADPENSRPWQRDTLQVVFSTTKGVTAACAHLLAQRGELDLDSRRPVIATPARLRRIGQARSGRPPRTAARRDGRLRRSDIADGAVLTVVTPPLDHNDPDEQSAEMPSTNGICTARALARFYAALIGEVDGHRHSRTRRRGRGDHRTDQGHRSHPARTLRIGTGFGLPTPDAFWYSPTAFGFPGFGGSLGFADPATGLAFGYVMNHIQEGVPGPRAANLVNAVQNAMKAHTP
jgi:CubicO group peptidase (beta-lactamase class C family)